MTNRSTTKLQETEADTGARRMPRASTLFFVRQFARSCMVVDTRFGVIMAN